MENNSGNEGSYTNELPEQHREAIARMVEQDPPIDEGSSSEPAYRRKRSIFKIPAKFQEVEYEPQVVSIGPYYRGNNVLWSMEPIKRRCLGHLIRKSEKNLELYWKKVHQLEQEAKNYYSDTTELNSVEFVEMMVLDGCFILEFCLFHTQQGGTNDEVHPIARIEMKKLREIFSDLLLSGNQIPFPVLTGLFEICSHVFPTRRFPVLIGKVFLFAMEVVWCYSDLAPAVEYKNDRGSKNPEPLHLLDMVRLCLLPPHPLQRKVSQVSQPCIKVPFACTTRSISKLRRAGIKVNPRHKHFWEVKFQGGVIEMSKIVLNDLTCSFLVNCAEFEHSYNYAWKGISSYVVLLDCLVDTGEDVDFLRENGILEHYKKNDDAAADFINSLGKTIAFEVKDLDNSLLWWGVNRYYMDTLHRQKRWYYRLWQRFKREYVDKPWLWISVLAGLVLLILTWLQTYYTARSYLHPKK